ncbi:MAG: hypothetical protein NW241_05830 [Bacteroidia bacterium]|nr:hypothetical protein [Bacteroidia bacterium]
MNAQELYARIQATKEFLNREIVRNRVDPATATLNLREIGTKMDMIHEVERMGIRNLDEDRGRKLSRMMAELERHWSVSLN